MDLCVCVQRQDVYAVESSVCFLYTEAVCTASGRAICSPAPVPTQSHPAVPAFLHSRCITGSRLTVKCFGVVNILDKAPKYGMVLIVRSVFPL